MPRIGVALEVAAVVALCIAFNTVRYPAVGQMLKGEPPGTLSSEAAKAAPAAAPSAAAAKIAKEPAAPAATAPAAAGMAAAVSAAPTAQPAVVAEKYAHLVNPPPQARTQTAPPEIQRPLVAVVWPKASPPQSGKPEGSAGQTRDAQFVGLPVPTEPPFCRLPPVEHAAPLNLATVCGSDGAIPFYPSTGL